MSEHSLRVPAYLEHILQAIRRIGRYTQGMTEAQFCASEMAQNAVIRNSVDLEIVWRTVQRDLPELERNVLQLQHGLGG